MRNEEGGGTSRIRYKCSARYTFRHSQKMSRQTGSKMCIIVLAFTAFVVGKPAAPAGLWTNFDKPASPRSLGSPFTTPGMSSITVPYMPKSSPFFPKFVDPKTMISRKTNLLDNLFSGLRPVDYTGGAAADFSQYTSGFPQSAPVLYMPYTNNGIEEMKDLAGTVGTDEKDNMKRGVFGPGDAKFGTPKSSLFPTFGPILSPFTSKFHPNGVSSIPFTDFPVKLDPGFVNTGTTSFRRRRSIIESENVGTKALRSPPGYPELTPIAEEPDSIESKLPKNYNSALTPKEMIPGMFGPFGPFSPYPAASITEMPIPKSTIVPADFWLPSSIIPGPMEYTDKVSTFLNKLFDSLGYNKTAPVDDGMAETVLARSLSEDPIQEKIVISRSLENIQAIAAAKDSIVDSILSELGDLKTEMITTLNDLIVFQKTAPVAPATKKGFKPPSPFAAFFAPPTPDPTLPFKHRMALLSQVFDMLTELQKNITLAVQDAIQSSTDAPLIQDSMVTHTENIPTKKNYFSVGNLNAPLYPAVNSNAAISVLNTTLFDVIKGRLARLDNTDSASSEPESIVSNNFQATAKRGLEDKDDEKADYHESHVDEDHDHYKRLVQMQMHQGYQSMAPGTLESVQAGGGSVPGHQGGGIKLLDWQKNGEDWNKWSEWAEYFKKGNQGRKNHYNHH